MEGVQSRKDVDSMKRTSAKVRGGAPESVLKWAMAKREEEV